MFNAVKARWPWLRTVATLNWHTYMPLDFPLDVWINSYTDWDWLLPKKAQLRDAWLAHGKRYWWYWCVGPEQPEFMNTFVERPGIEARLLPWLAALRNVDGLMYYQLNLWASQCADPEGHPGPGQPVTRLSCDPVRRVNGSGRVGFDPATFNISSGTRFGNGEGSFTYPSEHGLPMSSLRLEAIRDGVEDWELFRQLRAVSNDSVARSFITQLVRDGSPGGYTLDPVLLERARRGAARALIDLKRRAMVDTNKAALKMVEAGDKASDNGSGIKTDDDTGSDAASHDCSAWNHTSYNWSRFPAAWFGGSISGPESEAQLQSLGKYSVVLLNFVHEQKSTNYSHLLAAQVAQAKLIKERYPSTPVFVYGPPIIGAHKLRTHFAGV